MRRNSIPLAMLAAISFAFGWIVWPLAGAALWAVLLSVIFTSWYKMLLARMPQWPNAIAGACVLLIAILVVLPFSLVAGVLVQEASGVIERFQSGELDPQQSLSEFRSSLPSWTVGLLNQFEVKILPVVQEKLSTALTQGWQFVARDVLSFGQVTVEFLLGVFVMLYLLFYFLRDGDTMLAYVQRAIPLPPEQQQVLASCIASTVRGVLKGNFVVALVQGGLGGLIFWCLDLGKPILWGALMAVLALLPVVGTGLVWGPAAIYLLLSGSEWKGIVLLAFGILVISMIDNLLRPVLVGSDMAMPNYVVLVSSLGGIAVLGINGFVIGPLLAALFLAAWKMRFALDEAPEDTASR